MASRSIRRMRLTPVLILLLGLLAGPLPSQAAESPAIRSARATATLVADRRRLRRARPSRSGCGCGWRRAGTPIGAIPAMPARRPKLTLGLPDGATAGPIAWPAPQRIPTGPLVSFGYEHEVLLPMPVTAPATLAPDGSLAIEARPAGWSAPNSASPRKAASG